MPTENSEINDYLDKVMDIRKRSIITNHLLEERKEMKKINELLKKPGLWKIVKNFNQSFIMKAQNIILMHLKRKLRNFKKS